MSFFPRIPTQLSETGLTLWDLQTLLLKHFFHRRAATGREAAEHLCLPLPVIESALVALQKERMLEYRGNAGLGDFAYGILEEGVKQARQLLAVSSYAGAAPVPLDAYVESVAAQSLEKEQPTLDGLRAALGDMVIDPVLLGRIGQAMTAGRGMFLFGPPGNGKTSIAERVMNSYSDVIWIPKALEVGRTIIRLYDPRYHQVVRLDQQWSDDQRRLIDRRWVPIRRPTIVVAGELLLEHLEVMETASGVYEAPVQLKSNGGTFVVDDFGRQRMRPHDLLNRWILPLERRYDILNLPNGRSMQVPFDQFTIFSTNLEPSDLVDEAFLRRIPFKIEVLNPTVVEFRRLMEATCQALEIEYEVDACEYLMERHFHQAERPMRFCQPRDLMQLIDVRCRFLGLPRKLTREAIDEVAHLYFGAVRPTSKSAMPRGGAYDPGTR
ncbi:MAG: AAA family ATPase [Pirellulales bacterium]